MRTLRQAAGSCADAGEPPNAIASSEPSNNQNLGTGVLPVPERELTGHSTRAQALHHIFLGQREIIAQTLVIVVERSFKRYA
jgi:hypothetical protein